MRNNRLLLSAFFMVIASQLQAEMVKPSFFLKQQIVLAESIYRYDIAETALEHWLSIDRNDPEALFFQGRLNVLKGDNESAKKNMLAFEKIHPNHPELNKLRSLLDAFGAKKLQFQQAHFLAGNQRYNEAIAIYEQLFPYGMPTTAIEIEYFALLSKRSAIDFENTKKLIRERNIQYPDNPEYKLALANIITQKMPNDKEALAIYDQLSHVEPYKKQTAASWTSALSNIPIEKLTTQEIDDLKAAYPDDAAVDSKTNQLITALKDYQKLINDPTYQAKLQGFALLKEGKLELAEKSFLYAKTHWPNDPQIFKGLGQVRLNQSKRDEALTFFLKGKELDTNRDNDAEWNSLIATAQYWALIDRADNLAKSDQASAISLYKNAIQLDPKVIYPYLFIAKMLAANKNINEADAFFVKAIEIEPNNKEALLGRINLRVNNNNMAEALALTQEFTSEQKQAIKDDLDAIKINLLVSDAETALNNYDLRKASEKIDEAISFKTLNPWTAYRIASVLNQLNRKTDANLFVDQLLDNIKPSPESHFAAALYLAKQNKFLEALAEIDKIDPSQRTPSIIENQQRIWADDQFHVLDNLIKHDKQQAIAHLNEMEAKMSGDTNLLIRLADYWFEMNDIEHSKKIANTLNQNEKWPLNTMLAYAQLMVKIKELEKLSDLEKTIDLASASAEQKLQYRKLMVNYKTAKAKQYLEQGNKIAADRLYFSVLQEDPMFISVYNQLAKITANASDKNAKALMVSWVENHIAQLANPDANSDFPMLRKLQILAKYGQLGAVEKALQEIAADKSNEDRALYNASQIALTIKKWDIAEQLSFAALKKNKINNEIKDNMDNVGSSNSIELDENDKKQLYFAKNDDWLAKNIKSNIDELRKKTDGYVTVVPDYRFGTNTISKSVPVEVKAPFRKLGHFLFRIEPISLDGGTQDLSTKSNAKDYGSSLLCFPNCGQQQFPMRAEGVGYNAGWMGDHWKADLGRTPENFLVTDVVGGLRMDGDIKAFSWAVGVSKRAITNTTLSYAGLVDPNTKQTWGGARQTGIGVNLGFDNGGPVGVWSNWQFHKITGENIKDNTKSMGQIGTYWNAWKSTSSIFNVDLGLNLLYMSYNNNQNEFTFGHGGYFSPQSYASISMPISAYGRYNGWSYLVKISEAYSISKLDDAPYYPNNPYLQSQAIALGESAIYTGSNSNAMTYGISMIVEKRVADHWSIGARVQIQRSPFYNPSNIGLYLKYNFNEHWSPIETPPVVPETFASY